MLIRDSTTIQEVYYSITMALNVREETREHDDLSPLLSFTFIHSQLRYTCDNCMPAPISAPRSPYPRDASRNP